MPRRSPASEKANNGRKISTGGDANTKGNAKTGGKVNTKRTATTHSRYSSFTLKPRPQPPALPRSFSKVLGGYQFQSSSAPKPFLFLSLPPELRNKIYTHVLITSSSVPIFQRTGCCRPVTRYSGPKTPRQIHSPSCWKLHSPGLASPSLTWANGSPSPALFNVCRQVRRECLPIYYMQNRFELDFGTKVHWIATNSVPSFAADVQSYVSASSTRNEFVFKTSILERLFDRYERHSQYMATEAQVQSMWKLVMAFDMWGYGRYDWLRHLTLRGTVFLRMPQRQLYEWESHWTSELRVSVDLVKARKRDEVVVRCSMPIARGLLGRLEAFQGRLNAAGTDRKELSGQSVFDVAVNILEWLRYYQREMCVEAEGNERVTYFIDPADEGDGVFDWRLLGKMKL